MKRTLPGSGARSLAQAVPCNNPRAGTPNFQIRYPLAAASGAGAQTGRRRVYESQVRRGPARWRVGGRTSVDGASARPAEPRPGRPGDEEPEGNRPDAAQVGADYYSDHIEPGHG